MFRQKLNTGLAQHDRTQFGWIEQSRKRAWLTELEKLFTNNVIQTNTIPDN